MIRALIVGAALLTCNVAHAMTYAYKATPSGVVVSADGEVGGNEDQLFSKFLAAHAAVLKGKHVTVTLNSPGGAVEAGIKVGRIIREAHYDTDITAGGECYSICSVVWANGINKGVEPGAQIGVHSASYSENPELLSLDDIEALHEATEAVAAEMASLGAPADVLEAIRYCPGLDLYMLTEADLKAWNAHIVAA